MSVVHEAVGLFLTKNAQKLKGLIKKHLGQDIPLKDIKKELLSFGGFFGFSKIYHFFNFGKF